MRYYICCVAWLSHLCVQERLDSYLLDMTGPLSGHRVSQALRAESSAPVNSRWACNIWQCPCPCLHRHLQTRLCSATSHLTARMGASPDFSIMCMPADYTRQALLHTVHTVVLWVSKSQIKHHWPSPT